MLSNPTTQTWEGKLLSLAIRTPEHEPSGAAGSLDERRLAAAYRACTDLTARHSRSFYFASGLMPPAKRSAIRAVYAFCRRCDDIVDCGAGDCASELQTWRGMALGNGLAPQDPLALAWRDARRRYAIPRLYAEQLIQGVAQDLQPRSYASFDELATYAYGVASTVGLMSMHVIGYTGPRAVPYAIKLGVALQITNILRDVGEDLRRGRCYLPEDERAYFGIRRSDLHAGRVTAAWRSFMRFQIARNRRLYEESLPGVAYLHPDGRLAVAAAAVFYRGILDAIEANHYDVFTRRAHLSAWGKLKRMPAALLAARPRTL